MIDFKCCLCGLEIRVQEITLDNTCMVCENWFCKDCNIEHEHCSECDGSGRETWEILKNSVGTIDYLHGKPCGERQSEECSSCNCTGLRV